jgi:hypothetical protein
MILLHVSRVTPAKDWRVSRENIILRMYYSSLSVAHSSLFEFAGSGLGH